MTVPIWDPDVPADIRAIVEPYLTRWIGLLPTWCQRFEVRYDPHKQAAMAVHTNHRNRWAQLQVTGEWLAESDRERENAVIHELVHVALEPFVHAAGRILEDLTEEGTPLRELGDSMFTDGMECAVEDLARGIRRVSADA